jgi:hypothetical protein
LKKDKLEEKEAYYQALINFEVEQKLIKDIVWLEKTKQAYLERKARNDQYKEQRRQREEERKKREAEREAREKKRQEEAQRRKEEDAERQAEYERQQLKRVEIHPYITDMELCEQLIYFCVRTHRQVTKQDIDTTQEETSNAEKQKKIDDMISKNKMEAFERVDEQNFQVQGKKGKKKREGPSVIYEDDSNLQLEFPLIQKFGKLSVSPPVNADDLLKVEKSLQALRDAL